MSADATTTDMATAALPPVQRPSLVLLTTVELRKSVDTRAGRVLLAVILAIGLLVLGFVTYAATPEDPPAFAGFLQGGRAGVLLLLPVLGILAMTSEWTQRTVLSTFTLTPRRGRVLAAKLAAAVVLSTVLVLLVAVLAAVAVLVSGAVHGLPVTWDDAGATLLGTIISSALMVLMGAAIGALVMVTAPAIVIYYVVPAAVIGAASIVLKDNLPWVDVNEAFGRLADRDVSGHVGPILTSVALWVVLPLAAGVWRSLRRNVS